MKTKANYTTDFSERDQKRPRLSAEAKDATPLQPLGLLPADLWADVIDFLDLSEMICACLISNLFLREVIPQIRAIEVENANQLRAFIGRRFSGASVVSISCLFQYHDRNTPSFKMKYDAIERVVPFIANCSSIESVFFTGTMFTSSSSRSDAESGVVSGTQEPVTWL